jgi:hypothetical protein
MVVSWTFYLVIDGPPGMLVGAHMCNVCLSVSTHVQCVFRESCLSFGRT